MQEEANEDFANEDSVLATSVLSAMLAGNRKFADGNSAHAGVNSESRMKLIDGQHPGAVVLSCADSRVAPEFYSTPVWVIFFLFAQLEKCWMMP